VSKTVLVVDDDPKFLSDLSSLLNAEGYSTIAAKDGREAKYALDSHRVLFNAAIIDLALPEIGGFQIIGELARTQRRPIPLMAITGAYSDIYLEVARYLGAQVSIRKPPPGESLTPLVDALKQLLDPESNYTPHLT
jgi:CheY-like chemotaxis protein